MGTLIEDIENSIKQAGGRHCLADEIILESPNWFPIGLRRFIHRRADEIRRTYARRKKKTSARLNKWSDEDVEYLLKNYGTMKTRRLADALNRTSTTIRMKFSNIATDEQKAALIKKGNQFR